jgi:3-oxoacyl-[acyl-carrier protein] reductase
MADPTEARVKARRLAEALRANLKRRKAQGQTQRQSESQHSDLSTTPDAELEIGPDIGVDATSKANAEFQVVSAVHRDAPPKAPLDGSAPLAQKPEILAIPASAAAAGKLRMFDLTGKTALVTGATGGIGGAIARTLCKQGATVAISGRQVEKLEALKAELGARCVVVPCDLGNKEQVGKLIDEAVKALGGRLDILVNNAGLTRDNLFMVMKDAEWDEVIAVNLTSTFMLMRAGARHMMRSKTGFGRIINISSVSGIIGNPGQGNYAASKAGMIGMTKSLAREVASRGITANCIAPGFISTPMTNALNEKQVEVIKQNIPAQSFGTPDDIAAAALYLASPEARYVTGITLHVNGGMIMI